MEEFEFFWAGPFSQWYPSIFIIDEIKYNCAEQYMMAEKAKLFEDVNIFEKIMEAISPKEQKKLGRQVRNFDLDKWILHAKEIVYKGNLAKFTQNENLKEILISTGDKLLVEASPYDKVWGIGLAADDKRAKIRDTWLGKNWLGEILTQVRNDIQYHEKT